jgi:hypothetical protein
MRQRGDRLIEREVDVAGRDVANDVGGASLVRHELELGAGDLLEIDTGDVLAGAQARGALGRLVRIGLQPGDQLLEILRREILPHHSDIGILRQAGDRYEVLLDVVVQIVDRAVGDVRRPVADAHRVAVRRGVHGAADADGTVGAGDVLDHDRLAERRAHRLTQGPRHRVDRSAGTIGNDEGHRAVRVVLGAGGAYQRQGPYDDGRKLSHH